MGLDIFFHRFKSQSDDFGTINKENDELARKELSDYFVKKFKKLSKLTFGTDEYADEWNKFYKGLGKYTNYPEFHFDKLSEPMDVADAKPIADKYVESHYAPYNAYFRKVNFVYAFFAERLNDEWCFVDKQDCEELIARCENVLKDHSLAQELLPTQGGFFFGSTDYDKWYFRDCKDCIKEMKKLLKDWKDDERCFVDMSW